MGIQAPEAAAILRAGSRDRIGALYDCARLHHFKPEVVRSLLSEWWTDCEDVRRWRNCALMLFEMATRDGRGPVLDHDTFERPPLVYRTTCAIEVYDRLGRRKSTRGLGMSWSASKVTALWFTQDRVQSSYRALHGQEQGQSVILTLRTDDAKVFGSFHGRGEAEIVVDPQSVARDAFSVEHVPLLEYPKQAADGTLTVAGLSSQTP